MILHLRRHNMGRETYLIKQRAIEILGQAGLGDVCDEAWRTVCAIARAQLKEEGKI